MIVAIIRAAIRNRLLVLMGALLLAGWGVWAALHIPLDALPDLSDTQVILKTSWTGQPPQVVEDQLTYPLATTMLSVPDVKAVRAYSSFGYSLVYVIFHSGTNLYWARSRVLEYLSQARARLPQGVDPELGPDATGLGWVYEYALVDRDGTMDLGQLRALQDWYLRYQLKTVPGVAEVASIGGMRRAWQIVVDPVKLAAYGLTLAQVEQAVRVANGATGGSVISQGEADLMVQSIGYLHTREDFDRIPLTTGPGGVPVRLGEVAVVRRGPTLRNGIADLDGQGEVGGGVVIEREGANALKTIEAVKTRIAQLQRSLPKGVAIVPTYDRSQLILEAAHNLREKLLEEFLVVALVCGLFLWHLRSSLVAVVTLPLGVLAAFLVMYYQGVSANLMSLGGIAIAIGAMVDAAVVMIENAHKHLEHWREAQGRDPDGAERWEVIAEAAAEVGPALFVSLLVIALSFVPVFALQGQEGRLFSPLAFTKTYAMAAAAALAVTLVPVLMGYLIRGRIRPENRNPLNRALIRGYRPLLHGALRRSWAVLLGVALVLAASTWPLLHLGSEFMPPLNEGTLLYMPTALPGLSYGKAAQLLQQTDRLLKTVPEVATVFGKAGRAHTATDPAPINMFETTITFKPRSQWPPGMTMAKVQDRLQQAVRGIPGLTPLFVPPIANRVSMQSTGIKSPIGIKVLGPDPAVLQHLANAIVRVAQRVRGVGSAAADQSNGGRYFDVRIRPDAAARYGLTQADLQAIIATAVGGDPIGETVQGRERFPIVLRYPRAQRQSDSALRHLLIVAPDGAQLPLEAVATVSVIGGPSMLTSEDGQLANYVYIDNSSSNLGGVVARLQDAIHRQVVLPPGYTLEWAGQYAFLERAVQRLKTIVPLTLLIIFVLIWSVFRRVPEALLIMLTLPFALVGGIWLVWLLGHPVSVATMVGFIALAGVTSELGVVMLLYLRNAWRQRVAAGSADEAALDEAIDAGAVLRVRPIAMTAVVILAGLMPIMFGHGAGSEVMRSIAAPMVGGMITAPLLSMLVIPVGYRLLERRRLRAGRPLGADRAATVATRHAERATS
ncbi:MAG: CusA/CzcA family heavy metal efflux RND transporter [Metallibacterium scheffleri]|jgi:Cu(I)/Ag(I) efflux system membrane protein CusA/SilA|uniref:efflux RND transporter permease subunit n=1 Tax=Metallibacterium scheffleri TaxID=993689 RepID=UPI0026F30BDE|nr:CusA/CzcA family heavy metal efflux RND transporter [Metallibacterium scheffleri]MCK9367312.1 CusA/CzcA family heavy metal efflux RND transporter [Metallibacterium scheffleri]